MTSFCNDSLCRKYVSPSPAPPSLRLFRYRADLGNGFCFFGSTSTNAAPGDDDFVKRIVICSRYVFPNFLQTSDIILISFCVAPMNDTFPGESFTLINTIAPFVRTWTNNKREYFFLVLSFGQSSTPIVPKTQTLRQVAKITKKYAIIST